MSDILPNWKSWALKIFEKESYDKSKLRNKRNCLRLKQSQHPRSHQFAVSQRIWIVQLSPKSTPETAKTESYNKRHLSNGVQHKRRDGAQQNALGSETNNFELVHCI